MHNPDRAFEVSNDGLSIEDGALVISGSIDPSSISMTVPAFYLRTNGEIWKHLGTGSWSLISSSSFSEDQILTSKDFQVLISQSGDVLRGE